MCTQADSDLISRESGFKSEANFLSFYLNLSINVSEQIVDQIMNAMTRLDHSSNSSSALNLSLGTLLTEYPHTVDYILIGSNFSSAIMKSWTKSISDGNWTDVRFIKMSIL